MKIAFFHELHSGGARRASNEFSSQLIKKNHQVDLYLVDEELKEKEKQFYSSATLYKFIPRRWKGKDWKTRLYKDTGELYKLYKLHKQIAKDMNNVKYDLVIIHGSKFTQAPFILRFIKTKKIYYCQEPLRMVYEDILKIDPGIGRMRYFYENLNRLIRKRIDSTNISYADKILANSEYTRRNIYKAYGLKATVCYMGVDTNVFKPEKIEKIYDVLFIGAYGYMDGYPLLEHVIKLCNNKIKIGILASERKWIDNDIQMRQLYSKSKLALALAHNEPFGLVPLEAMACGLPVVAVNDGGYKESIVNGVTGYLVTRDATTVYERINALLKDSKKLKAMSLNARQHVINNWTWIIAGNKLESLL
jgi:glycosyltransferase involved in cell wall biosynthesis